MKTNKYFLVLMVVTGIFCLSALGQVELRKSDEAGVIGQANPTLKGIEQLYAIVIPPDSEPNKDGLVWEELEAKVEYRLKEAKLGAVKPRSLPTPHLNIEIDMLKLSDLQQYIFRIQTSLVRTVTLSAKRNLHLDVDVWKTDPVMQAVSVEDMPDRVTEVVLKQAETFIVAYFAANPPEEQPLETEKSGETSGEASATEQKDPNAPAAKSAEAESKYVASRKSKIFHKAQCDWAKTIKPENLITYNDREDAIKAGKRPCTKCKP